MSKPASQNVSAVPANRVGWVLYGTFLLSGAAGLMYQVAWTRYLSLLLGSTGIAQIIVLSTFMGGLGLGAWLFGKRADRSPSCLRLFVLLEFAIALYAVFFPLFFDALRGGYLGVARGLEPGSSPLLALKSVTAVVAILLPTVLMGGTLPVLSKYVTERLDLVGRQVARLYYLNSFGAVAGCLLAGFWFVGTYGLAVTMAIGASLDFLVAVVLGWRGLRQPAEATTIVSTTSEPTDINKTDTVSSNNEATDTNATNIEPTEGVAPEIYPEHLGRLALVVIGLSGVVSFIYEIVWIRMLALILGSSTYSFSLMVAAFIFGITLGSFLISFKRTDRGYYPLLGWLELAIGLTLLLSLPLYMWLPYTLNQLQGLLQRTPEAFPLYQLIKFSLCFAVMVPPTVFIGMTLPAASKIATRGLGTLGSQVGSVFAINTAGTLIGAVLGGAILMPWLGLRDTLLVGIVTNLALGFLILATAPGGLLGRREENKSAGFYIEPFRKYYFVGALGLILIGFAGFQQAWNDRALIRTVYRMHEVFVNWDEYQDYISYGDILYNTDGLDASIVVMEWGDGGRTLYINGKPDASVMGNFDDGFSGDMNNQLVTGHLPMLTHGNAKEVLVVGQGSGVSVMAAASYPDANVELVELSGEIIETAPYFAAGNLGYYDWPNVKIIQEDARTYLFLEEKKYDVIINEPSNPWVAGNASLFTKEYMEACAAKLNDGGIFYQWVQTYETSQDAHDLIMRTYESVFPYYSIWKVSPGDTGVIGSMRPIEIDLGRVLELMEQTEINRQLASVGMEIPEVLFGFQFFQNGALGQGAPYEPSGLFNSEFTPLLEYQAPLSFFIDESVPNLHERDQRFHPLESQLLLRHQYMTADFDRKSFAEDRWQFAQARYDSQNSSVPDPTLEILGGWLKQHPESADAALVLQTQSEYISAESRVEKLSQLDPGEFTDSSRYYRELGEAALELAHLKWRLGQAFDQETTLAIEQFEALIKLEGDQAWEAHQFLGRAHVLAGDLAKASEHYQQALSIGEESAGEVGYYLSDHHPLVKEMVRLYAHLGDAETLQQLVPRLRRDPNASLYLGRAYNHLVEAGVIEVDQ